MYRLGGNRRGLWDGMKSWNEEARYRRFEEMAVVLDRHLGRNLRVEERISR